MDENRSRHADIDHAAFEQRVRQAINTAIDTVGHHPFRGYTPTAWRHYTRRLALLDRCKTLEFQSALDVGCSEGFFMDAIAQSRQCEVWGVDLSDAAVKAAKTRYGLPVAAAQATALPFADGAFDLVFSSEVIEHVLEPRVMLAEMRRVARRHVLVTTPVSQSDHAHRPDYELSSEGHVNDFDLPAMRALFGASADIRSYRNNSTFALLTLIGRRLPAGLRDVFYRLDLAFAKRWGAPHHRFKALRNRDWLIVSEAAATPSNIAEWRCPHCHRSLKKTEDGLHCETDRLRFPYLAPDVADFASEQPDAAHV